VNASTVIQGIERFFNDLIGLVVPGLTLFVLLVLFLFSNPAQLAPDSTGHWLFVLASGFIMGHVMVSLGETMVPWLINRKWLAGLRNRLSIKLDDEIDKSIRESVSYAHARDVLNHWLGWDYSQVSVRDLRNIAMSVLSAPDNDKIYRFRFISQLCLGVATAILVAVTVGVAILILQLFGDFLSLHRPGYLVPLAVGFVFLIERSSRFSSMSMRVPFDMVVAEIARLRQKTPNAGGKISFGNPFERRRAKIFLSGGLHSNWQDHVVATLGSDILYLNPRMHGLTDPKHYTNWNLQAVDAADLVFAYMEATNPSGYGLALEVGYALGRSTPVILVDERSCGESPFDRYFAQVSEAATVCFNSLDEGLDYVRMLPLRS
jgi:hypothetical protein